MKYDINMFFFGNGHKTRFSRIRIKIAIASKIKCKKIFLDGFPVLDELGGVVV